MRLEAAYDPSIWKFIEKAFGTCSAFWSRCLRAGASVNQTTSHLYLAPSVFILISLYIVLPVEPSDFPLLLDVLPPFFHMRLLVLGIPAVPSPFLDRPSYFRTQFAVVLSL